MDTSKFYDKKYYQNRKKTSQYGHKINKLVKAVIKYKPQTVLDVGCGHGFLVKKLTELGIYAKGLDFSKYAGSEIPYRFVQSSATNIPFENNTFDVVVSSDFFEHLPEEDIDQVYSEMKRVGGQIIALIAFKPDKVRKNEEIDTHLTVKPREWWEKKVPEIEILN